MVFSGNRIVIAGRSLFLAKRDGNAARDEAALAVHVAESNVDNTAAVAVGHHVNRPDVTLEKPIVH